MTYPILIVDDEPQIRRLIQFLLADEGLAALEAPDGAAALQVAQGAGGKISLVLTDVHMPGMTGIELARSVGQVFPGIPILFMSGIPPDMLGQEVPVNAFIQKPFLPGALTAAIREALARGRGDAARSLESSRRAGEGASQEEGIGSVARLILYRSFQTADADEPPQHVEN